MIKPGGRGFGGSHHFHFPAQGLLGLVFGFVGGILLMKKLGNDYLPFLPEDFLVLICAIGSLLGGIYLLITAIWKPRIYLQ